MQNIRRILVFRVGLLGDTIVALPSLHAIRKNFPEARITLLHERPSQNHVQVEQLLDGSGLVDDYLVYTVLSRDRLRVVALLQIIGLGLRLRWRRYDLLVHLAPGERAQKQNTRDNVFFHLAGISRQITTSPYRPAISGRHPLPPLPPEADFLLSCLGREGLKIPEPGRGAMDLRLGVAEDSEVMHWEREAGLVDDGRLRVAFGLGSKMPAKRWPLDRYVEVARYLVDKWDILPIAFGGVEDAAVAVQLLLACGRGVSACGKLGLRGALRALRDCRLYVGNDTGTMHLAAVAGVRCVAIFSARNSPGKWYPYGIGHRVHRVTVACEGCGLEACIVEGMRCLKAIEPAEIIASCEEILREKIERRS
jgi:heptosyltransferase III